MSPFEILQSQMDVINQGIKSAFGREEHTQEELDEALKECWADEQERIANKIIAYRKAREIAPEWFRNYPINTDGEGNFINPND